MTGYIDLIAFIMIVGAAAVTGARFAPGDWYRSLDRPSWTPPDWAFPVVWTTLYLFIAIAGWLVWRAEGMGLALAAWGANLVFNAAWSWIMFGRKQIALALVDALAMLATIVAFIVLAWPASPWAALLFLPYGAWVMTAIALNYEILRRNPEAATAN